MPRSLSSILDTVHPTLPSNVWEQPESPAPNLRPVHAHFITKNIYAILEHGGYTKPKEWLNLYFTGSLCTYQYSDSSDADVSLFVDSDLLPEWSRAEMIGLMIEGTEGLILPGTTFELQGYVVNRKLKPPDLFKPHLRAGYSIDEGRWISPPDHSMAHDVHAQENGFYVWAMEQADKMERLLRYEPDKATDFWHQIHKRRMRDQVMDKGDYSESNILYKFLAKRNLLPEIAQVSGEHIARGAMTLGPDHPEYDPYYDEMAKGWRKLPYLYHQAPAANREDILREGLRMMQPTHPHAEPGVYVEGNPEMSQGYWGQDSKDLWRIDQRHVQDLLPDYSGQAAYIPHNVPPEALQRTTAKRPELIDRDRLTHAQFRSQNRPRTGRTAVTDWRTHPSVIDASEARGNSRPVSLEEFQRLAEEGRQRYESLKGNSSATSGLDTNWPGLVDWSYQQVQTPWGGATIDAHTGQPVRSNADAYALSVRPPGMWPVTIPNDTSSEGFAQAMNQAKSLYQPILERADHHLGVFRDEDTGSIDFDPVLVVNSPREVETIGAHTHATGGAYHFQTGEGHFPPHVEESDTMAA